MPWDSARGGRFYIMSFRGVTKTNRSPFSSFWPGLPDGPGKNLRKVRGEEIKTCLEPPRRGRPPFVNYVDISPASTGESTFVSLPIGFWDPSRWRYIIVGSGWQKPIDFFFRQAQDDENGFFNDPVTVLSFLSVVVRKTISFCHPDPTGKAYPGRISKWYGFAITEICLEILQGA